MTTSVPLSKVKQVRLWTQHLTRSAEGFHMNQGKDNFEMLKTVGLQPVDAPQTSC